MLYRISSPILWRGVKAANDSVRRQAAILLFDNFPLRDPQFNHEAMDRALQKQFDAFEELLEDSHPAVRIAAISGVAKVLSVYWELLPAETIRCFISKLVVDLVNDASSSAVRAAVFEGIQFILDNHNAHAILKPLLPMLAPLIHDRHERVRAEFAALLVRIKSIRNLHFYDIVPVNELLERLVIDRECPLVRKQLVLLFLNSYFPQSVGGSSQVARCLSLVKKHPEAAMVFYGHVADHASVGSVCKLAALLCRCSLNFVSRRLKKEEEVVEHDEDEDDDDDESFSIVGRIVILEIMVSLVKSVHVKVLNDERYAECKTFLAQQLSAEALKALIAAYSTDHPFDAEALRAIWKIAGYLGDIVQEDMLESLVAQLMATNESSSKPLVDAMVECLAKWHQLPSLVSKVEDVLLQWRQNNYVMPTASSKSSTAKKTKKSVVSSYRLHPIVALSSIEFMTQISTSPCPKHLLDRLLDTLQRCASPLMELSTRDLVALIGEDGEHAFGVLRLLEVYAKLLVVVEAAQTTSQTTLLFESSTLKLKTLDASTRAALRSLQPSGFFSPPDALAKLLQWIVRVLMDLHLDKDQSGASKKSTKKRSRRGESASDNGTTEGSKWVARWRNLFSLTAMLATECAAFALEHADSHTVVTPFLDTTVSALAEAASRLTEAECADRAVVLHATHLLSLLEKKASKEQRWTEALADGLRAAHTRHTADVDDLLVPMRALLGLEEKQNDEQEVEQEEEEEEDEGGKGGSMGEEQADEEEDEDE
ncbi:hypothetical protein PINS_up002112 [Pythium insidiosum]|nr:hypothetical protein PINS_up002112 [Pythium insidiosum]